MTRRQRERKKLRARVHQLLQKRKPVDVPPPTVVGVVNNPVSASKEKADALRRQFEADSKEAMDRAKRRKQGKLKTWALWQRHMEANGYFLRAERGILSVYKDGVEVGEVAMFGTGPDAARD